MLDSLKAVKVGVFVLLAVAAAFLSYRLVEERAADEAGYRVYAIFDDVQGLVTKSRVQIAGIPVGYIDAISLENGRARVDIFIREGVGLYEDARVAKKSASLLGEALLAIYPGDQKRESVSDGDRIAVAEDTPGTDDIMKSVGEIAESVKAVTHQMERVFGNDRGGDQMASALDNLSGALEAVNRTIQQNEQVINRTLANVQATTDVGGPQVLRILDNIEVVTNDMRRILGENREGLTEAGGDVSQAVASFNRSAQKLEDIMEDVRTVTDRTARGEGTIGRLTSDEELIDEVQNVVEDVGDLVAPMGRLQTIVGLQSEYNFLANTFKSYVSLRLQPREDRYYLIELIDDPRGRTEFVQTSVRRSPPADGEPAFYQETRVETKDAFRFSLMFAKRIHFATFRFGVLESTGGFGVDLHLFNDRLELTGDVFAFGEKAFPRLRTRLAFEVVSRLWILGGIDDALNDSSDFFLGAALRFNDRDLKTILPFAGGVSTGG